VLFNSFFNWISLSKRCHLLQVAIYFLWLLTFATVNTAVHTIYFFPCQKHYTKKWRAHARSGRWWRRIDRWGPGVTDTTPYQTGIDYIHSRESEVVTCINIFIDVSHQYQNSKGVRSRKQRGEWELPHVLKPRECQNCHRIYGRWLSKTPGMVCTAVYTKWLNNYTMIFDSKYPKVWCHNLSILSWRRQLLDFEKLPTAAWFGCQKFIGALNVYQKVQSPHSHVVCRPSFGMKNMILSTDLKVKTRKTLIVLNIHHTATVHSTRHNKDIQVSVDFSVWSHNLISLNDITTYLSNWGTGEASSTFGP